MNFLSLFEANLRPLSTCNEHVIATNDDVINFSKQKGQRFSFCRSNNLSDCFTSGLSHWNLFQKVLQTFFLLVVKRKHELRGYFRHACATFQLTNQWPPLNHLFAYRWLVRDEHYPIGGHNGIQNDRKKRFVNYCCCSRAHWADSNWPLRSGQSRV